MTLPVKSIDEIEVKSEVSTSDKILILDSVSEEARLASKTELKGDKGDKGDPGDKGDTGLQGPAGKDGANGKDGKDGVDGKDGKDGADGNGIASITSSKVGKTTTVTITETNGDSESFQILDGEDGSGGQGDGDVKGPASSTDGHLAVFDGTTGKIIKDGGAMPTIPTKVSDLSNDSGFITSAALPTKVSDLNNDSGFITGITSLDVTTALGYTPYDASNPSGYTTNTGDVVGPASSTDGHLAVFDGATGKLIKDGGAMPTIPSVSTITVTLAAANWSSQSITVSASGVTASNTVIVAPDPTSITDYTNGGIYCSSQASNSLTFVCDTEPSNDIDVNVVILG